LAQNLLISLKTSGLNRHAGVSYEQHALACSYLAGLGACPHRKVSKNYPSELGPSCKIGQQKCTISDDYHINNFYQLIIIEQKKIIESVYKFVAVSSGLVPDLQGRKQCHNCNTHTHTIM